MFDKFRTDVTGVHRHWPRQKVRHMIMIQSTSSLLRSTLVLALAGWFGQIDRQYDRQMLIYTPPRMGTSDDNLYTAMLGSQSLHNNIPVNTVWFDAVLCPALDFWHSRVPTDSAHAIDAVFTIAITASYKSSMDHHANHRLLCIQELERFQTRPN